MELDGKAKVPLIDKFFELEMNFDLTVHVLLSSLLTNILPLDITIHMVFMFLIEGQKVLFRMIIATLNSCRPFIIDLYDSKQFMTKLS